MNREELLMHHAEVCAKALEIMQVKNHDYAGKNGEEPFANFERCEAERRPPQGSRRVSD